MTWAMVAGAVVSAGAGIYSSQQAANAQSDAGKKNAALQQQQLAVQLGLIEPQRQLGYGAMSDLASLYGYNLTPYQSGANLMDPYASGSAIKVGGRTDGGFDLTPSGKGFAAGGLPLPGGLFGDGDKKKFGGTIDPVTGTVNITNGGKKEALREAQLTDYLRTGEGNLGGKFSRFAKEIDRLRGSGWEYDPNAASAAANYSPAAGSATGGTSSNGAAGNMARFFTSPDYQFRQSEGVKALDATAAARGGALSGNAVRGATDFSSNLAAGEYGNYVNRLLQMAGLGSSANSQGGAAVNNYVNGTSAANTAVGDARASGVMGSANSITGAINGGLNSWILSRYLSGAGAGAGAGASSPQMYYQPGAAPLPGGGSINPMLPYIGG